MAQNAPVPSSVAQKDATPVVLINSATGMEYTVGGAGDGSILDGVNNAIKATVLDYIGSNPLAVRLTDTDGNYVGAGAGTQYADGALRGSATGTLAMGDDGTNIQSVHVDTSGDLQVDVLTMPTTTVTGTVTANLGTIADVATQTTLSAINAKLVTGTDIGDVTINNAAGVAAVNIQDGGNSITVDGTFFQATQPVSIAATVTVSATDLDIRNLASGTDSISAIQSGTWNVGTLTSITNTVTNSDAPYTTAIEFSGANPVYVGEAAAGSTKASASWRIKKITYSGSNPIDVQYADGVSTFTKVWDSRATYTYS